LKVAVVQVVRVQNRTVRRREHQFIGDVILPLQERCQQALVTKFNEHSPQPSRHVHATAFLALGGGVLASNVVVLDDDEAISVLLVLPELNISPLNCYKLTTPQACAQRTTLPLFPATSLTSEIRQRRFKRQVAEDKSAAQNSCDFLESAGFNVIASDNDPKSQMEFIEAYSVASPASKFQDQVSSYAMYTLAGAYIDDAKAGSGAKAMVYSQKAISVANAEAADADKSRKLSAGVAHSIVGYGDI
jgi:hypothetical protein